MTMKKILITLLSLMFVFASADLKGSLEFVQDDSRKIVFVP